MVYLRIALLFLAAIALPALTGAGVSSAATKGFYADEAMFIIPLEGEPRQQGFGIVKGILNGNHATRVNTRSHMSFYILGGECRFTQAQGNTAAQTGDYLTITPDTPYAIEGKNCEMLILSTPPFDEKYNKRVDSL